MTHQETLEPSNLEEFKQFKHSFDWEVIMSIDFSGDNLKVFFIVLIFACGWLGVLSPRCFDPFGKKITFGNLFSSGVLMSASLVHLLGDATGELDDAPLPKTADGEAYPWGFLFCALSFYFLFIVERLFIGMYVDNMIRKSEKKKLKNNKKNKTVNYNKSNANNENNENIDNNNTNDKYQLYSDIHNNNKNSNKKQNKGSISHKSSLFGGDATTYHSYGSPSNEQESTQKNSMDSPDMNKIIDNNNDTKQSIIRQRNNNTHSIHNDDNDNDIHTHKHTEGPLPHVDDEQIIDLLLGKQYLSAIVLLVGLGIHSFFAGLALGATKSFNVAITLGIAIVCHKYLAAFALGVPLFKSQQSLIFSIFIATLFGSFTPIGIGLGWALENSLDGWVTDILVCIASGTFLYVSIVEVLIPEFSSEKHMETHILKENKRIQSLKESQFSPFNNSQYSQSNQFPQPRPFIGQSAPNTPLMPNSGGGGGTHTNQVVVPVVTGHGSPTPAALSNTPTFQSTMSITPSIMLDQLKQQSHRQDCLKMTFVVAGFAIMSMLAIWV